MLKLDVETGIPYVPLPSPHSAFVLTLLLPNDAEGITSSINHLSVLCNLLRAPEPFSVADAQSYLLSKSGEYEEAASTDWMSMSQEDRLRTWMRLADDAVAIRRKDNGRHVGQLGIRRNTWDWIEDLHERERLIEDNDKKAEGDPSIQYSIGAYLSPTLHSRGLVTCAVDTLIQLASRYLNMHHLEAICRKDNIASRRVMEKNGFRRERETKMLWRGIEREIYVMKWQRKASKL